MGIKTTLFLAFHRGADSSQRGVRHAQLFTYVCGGEEPLPNGDFFVCDVLDPETGRPLVRVSAPPTNLRRESKKGGTTLWWDVKDRKDVILDPTLSRQDVAAEFCIGSDTGPLGSMMDDDGSDVDWFSQDRIPEILRKYADYDPTSKPGVIGVSFDIV